jgi:hypothetical protein
MLQRGFLGGRAYCGKPRLEFSESADMTYLRTPKRRGTAQRAVYPVAGMASFASPLAVARMTWSLAPVWKIGYREALFR